MQTDSETHLNPHSIGDLESVVIRFAGDSGDGIQLLGAQFTTSTALAGSGLTTFPDFPAEIRAPLGTTFGVSAYQIKFGARKIFTSGDQPDVLVALNPAALKVNVGLLREGSLIVVDTGTFVERNFKKAHIETNPLEDGSLAKFQVLKIDISRLTLEAVKEFELGNKNALRSKNLWALGLMLWMFDHDRGPTTTWLNEKFANKGNLAAANIAALNAGHAFGETAELSGDMRRYHVGAATSLEPGLYRTVTGAQALAWGLAAAGQLAKTPLVFCS